jgi:hypothetical protein
MSPAAAQAWESLFWALFERATKPAVPLDVHQPTLDLLGCTRGCLIGSPLMDVLSSMERARTSAATNPSSRSRTS